MERTFQDEGKGDISKTIDLRMSSPPLDHLPPVVEAELVYHWQAYAYDWLLSIPDEVEICLKHGLGWSMAVYFLSRTSEFVHGFLPANSCGGFWSALGPAIVLTASSTSFLFLLRVRAVYLGSWNVTAIFGVLWLITMGLVVLAAVTTHLGHGAGTELCGVNIYTKYLSWPSISLVRQQYSDIHRNRLPFGCQLERSDRAHLALLDSGNGAEQGPLPHIALARAVRLAVLRVSPSAIILFFFMNLIYMASPLVPEIQKYTLVNTYVTFTNIMACRVFRGVALGMLVDSNTVISMGSIRVTAPTTRYYPPPAAYKPTRLRA
ncbi:hypothetical protein FIBSPDRAFT_946849 [Athelia psychrophila]|uniref:Uncharacterized protein n=1 Tax=Athelia psychrophila TaxID=1759441 RepID=A0A166SLY2_9AGAM|nr:hypothetical protein FIBSPDRAFT_946849 [Fibularhizoctonia sp. CBS 109695]